MYTLKEPIKTITVKKETKDYRIVTDDPANWYLVANRPIAKGEFISPPGSTPLFDVTGIEVVAVIIEETQERKNLSVKLSAVPNDITCIPKTLEIPWCFMNHSCKPNTMDKWLDGDPRDLDSAETAALYAISEGEELTCDYALEQYDYKIVKCLCGEETCRSFIGSFSKLSPAEQKEIYPMASSYVQGRYREALALKYSEHSPRGRHLIVDYWECNPLILNDESKLLSILEMSAKASGANVMSIHSHSFDDKGVTAIAILAESHISIHTWPGKRCAEIDVFTCGTCDPLAAHKVLVESLNSERYEFIEISRGRELPEKSIAYDNGQTSESRKWYIENNVLGRFQNNVYQGFAISEILVETKTEFQECIIFENPFYGIMVALDGIIQLSTSDEHIYHEMLVHPVMFSHPAPSKVLIVGGGDGGALREVLKHDPEEVILIDIDKEFVKLAMMHLPGLSQGAFDDERVKVLYEDANVALKSFSDYFDVAIIDCNDAVGTSEVLFSEKFYETIKKSLKNKGACSIQAGPMSNEKFISETINNAQSYLGKGRKYRATIPSFHCGEYVFVVLSENCGPGGHQLDDLKKTLEKRRIETNYWSPEIHFSSQVFPIDKNSSR